MWFLEVDLARGRAPTISGLFFNIVYKLNNFGKQFSCSDLLGRKMVHQMHLSADWEVLFSPKARSCGRKVTMMSLNYLCYFT